MKKKPPYDAAKDVVLAAEIPSKGVVLITRQQLDEAEQEMLAEMKLQGATPPSHRAMDEAEQACSYCTMVSWRAVAMFIDKVDGPTH